MTTFKTIINHNKAIPVFPMTLNGGEYVSGGTTQGFTLLDNAVATGAGEWVDTGGAKDFAISVVSTEVTDGGTMVIEADINGSIVEIDRTVISSNASYVIKDTNSFTRIRANLVARTDGTYNADIVLRL